MHLSACGIGGQQAFEHMPNEKTENAKKLWLMPLMLMRYDSIQWFVFLPWLLLLLLVLRLVICCFSPNEVEHPTLSNENMKTQRRVESA